MVGAVTAVHASPGGPAGVPMGDMVPEHAGGDVLAAGGDPGDLSLPSSVPVGVSRRRTVGAILGAVDAEGGADDDGGESSEAGEELEH